MSRWSILSIGLVFVLSCVAVAQDSPDAPLFSSDLIAWSGMQQPTAPEKKGGRQQPTPDPTPESQPAPNPASQNSQSASASTEGQAPTAQTFTGIVSKDTDSFMLKVSENTSYKLDNQQQVQQYVGQRVRVIGTLDSSINLIHVDRIEPLS